MNKIAIKPHKNRGNEIIKIFENRGFRNPCKYDGNYSENITKDYAFIGGCDGAEDCIILTDIVYLKNIGYKICTLEEYENEHKAMKGYNFNELQNVGVKPGDIVAYNLRGFSTSWRYVLLRDGLPDKFTTALCCDKDKRNPDSMYLSQIGFYWVGDIDNLQFRLTTYDEKNAFVQACVTTLNEPITELSFWGKNEYSQILYSMLKWGLISENEVNELNKKLKKLHGVDLLKTYDKLFKK